MHTTSTSLLARLRQPGEGGAWEEFVDLYTPLLFYWARRMGLKDQDAADLVQDVFALLLRKLPEFEYDEGKSFRAWLRTVTVNKWREGRRRRTLPVAPGGEGDLAELADPAGDEAFWEAEYRQCVVGRAMRLMQSEFRPTTWRACWEHAVAGRPAAEVAAELGLSVGAVYAARFRVLARLRQELEGLVD
jgi:RNA polymerase sigma-70 factor (ECF subfamily)